MSLNVLIIDIDGLSLSFAWRCVQAGHAVRWFVKPGDEVNKDTGLGFRGIEKINNWVASIKWADLVLLTGNSEYVERLDAFKKRLQRRSLPIVVKTDADPLLRHPVRRHLVP